MSARTVRGPQNLPPGLLEIYEKWNDVYQRRPSWSELGEGRLWEELCFCILSSNVPYEMACTALVQLTQKGLLDFDDSRRIRASSIASELSRPVYHPRRKDGSLRVYRFPRNGAHNIVGAWTYLYLDNAGLRSLLRMELVPAELRSILASNVPGIGFKEASHFLRDVKYTDALAVIDTHIVSFLDSFVEPLEIGNLTPRRYVQLEALMIELAKNLGLSPAVLDMAVWEYMRAS
jgi:N-glycosylase/DNA lyase